MKNKSILIYLFSTVGIIALSFLINLIFFQTNLKYFIMFSMGFAIVGLITIMIISKKTGVAIDILSYDFSDEKSLLLNDLFIGILLSIPVSIFINAFL